MAKNKERSEIEFYRGKLREAQKEIKSLRRQLKSLSRKEHTFDDVIEEYQELLDRVETDDKPKSNICSKCNIGKSNLVITMDKKDIYECNSCGIRKVINK